MMCRVAIGEFGVSVERGEFTLHYDIAFCSVRLCCLRLDANGIFSLCRYEATFKE